MNRRHLKKGDTVLCIGKIKVEDYTDRNGEAKKSKKLVCEFVMPMAVAPAAPQPVKNAALPDDLSDFEEILGDSDVPF